MTSRNMKSIMQERGGEHELAKTSGEIVASRISKQRTTGVREGYIVILTPTHEHVRFRVDSSTSFESLERGEKVTVEYETLGDTDILVAKKIVQSF